MDSRLKAGHFVRFLGSWRGQDRGGMHALYRSLEPQPGASRGTQEMLQSDLTAPDPVQAAAEAIATPDPALPSQSSAGAAKQRGRLTWDGIWYDRIFLSGPLTPSSSVTAIPFLFCAICCTKRDSRTRIKI